MEDDVIIGGPGNDTLRGNGGSDLFVCTGPDDVQWMLTDTDVDDEANSICASWDGPRWTWSMV